MKKNESKFIGIKEIVAVTLFSVLTFVISMLTAMPFAASVHLQLYVGYALMAIISGPIYVLMISKAPKIGTQVLFFGLKGLYMLLMGQVLTGIIFIIGGVLCELIVMGDGYRNMVKSGVAYALHTTLYGLGSFFPVIFFADNYAKQLIDKGYQQELVDTMLSLYRSPLIVATVALVLMISSVIGMCIGSRMIKKHFQPAGVA
ncbi:MAG: MptD family putative ECF transporter S component [Oscillospiraceae bacterium]|nr:MptD family putative ECF transporter S component [Oscillospiraceae bacterium]